MSAGSNPAAFGPRGTLALIVAGFLAFIGLLSWLGTGEAPANNGGAHALGKGIAGYAALATMLAEDGHQVSFNRAPGHVGGDELVVLTPLPDADAKAIRTLIQARRNGIGPTILVLPKWQTMLLDSDPRALPANRAWAGVFGAPAAPTGWTTIVGTQAPRWPGLLDRVGVALGRPEGAAAHGWHSGDGASGRLPDDRVVLSGGGSDDTGAPLVPLVRGGDGRILAGYFADGGAYPALDAMAGIESTGNDAETGRAETMPLVIVFEPDLFDNRGFADEATALMARRLILASAGRGVARIVFDLSLAGLGAPQNLLTLAFTPPFLAATICLMLAMAGTIWRGFARFGPARIGDPDVPRGKVALVGGGAALLLRARRHHLIGGPYADATRERLTIALGLPRHRPAPQTDAAIERIQQGRAPGTAPFGEVVARLTAARGGVAIATVAAELHTIERALGHAGRNEGP